MRSIELNTGRIVGAGQPCYRCRTGGCNRGLCNGWTKQRRQPFWQRAVRDLRFATTSTKKYRQPFTGSDIWIFADLRTPFHVCLGACWQQLQTLLRKTWRSTIRQKSHWNQRTTLDRACVRLERLVRSDNFYLTSKNSTPAQRFHTTLGMKSLLAQGLR